MSLRRGAHGERGTLYEIPLLVVLAAAAAAIAAGQRSWPRGAAAFLLIFVGVPLCLLGVFMLIDVAAKLAFSRKLGALAAGLRLPEKRLAALDELRQIGTEAAGAAPALAPLLADADPEARLAAARALVAMLKTRAADAVPVLLAALDDARARPDALEALGRVGPAAKAAAPKLMALLSDRSFAGRWQAAWALGELQAAEAAEVLGAALDDPDKDAAEWAARALGELGPAMAPAVPGLLRACRDPRSRVQSQAIEALGRCGDAAAVAPLSELLKDPERSVRGTAAVALGRLGKLAAPAASALKALTEDADHWVRAVAESALAAAEGRKGPLS